MTAVLFLTGYMACTTDPYLGDNTSDPTDPNNPGGGGGDTTTVTTDPNACPEGTISFQKEVLPLLVSGCAVSGCHNAASHKEGVILETYAQVKSRVKAGNATSSKLYRVLSQGGGDRMPPPPYDAFTAEQKDLIKNWINQGAENTDCNPACNPANFGFAADILPIIKNSCNGCHSGTSPQGSVNLTDYNHIKGYVDNGSLLGAIQRQAGFNPMPPTGGPLSDCRIEQIRKWVDAGAPNN
ncbi:MAG: hypothetical protein H6562_22640 [Lewinellaceae bacterium]|nr:hypothetical protein [Lewinella sp.]MCB9281705.1 hypothetical protein [Lewinellaceae bacterium]